MVVKTKTRTPKPQIDEAARTSQRHEMIKEMIGVLYEHAHPNTQVVLNASRPDIGLMLEGYFPDGRAFRVTIQEGDAEPPKRPIWNRPSKWYTK